MPDAASAAEIPARKPAPWLPMVAGVLLSAPFVAGIVLLRDPTLDVLALLLALTGGVYAGAALHEGSRRVLLLEVLAGVACLFCAAMGFWWTSAWVAGGYLFHAAWDVLHHAPALDVPVRPWFPPFCAAFDLAVALAIFLLR